MDFRLIRRLVAAKLRDPTTYGVAAIVGVLINVYGQLLVPWFRGAENPFEAFLAEFTVRPYLSLFSVFLAFAFPLAVGVYSSVATRYKNRRVESVADFPERKPDPVFRTERSGRLIEVGATTQALFERYGVDCAQKILGEEVWAQIVSGTVGDDRPTVYFAAEGVRYQVAHSRTNDDEINFYLTRLSA